MEARTYIFSSPPIIELFWFPFILLILCCRYLLVKFILTVWPFIIKTIVIFLLFILNFNPGSSDIDDVSGNLEFIIGQSVAGYVSKVESEWVWLTISRNVGAKIYILDSATEPSELEDFQNRYLVGQHVSGHVLSFNTEKKLLRLVLHPFSTLLCRTNEVPQINIMDKDLTAYVHEGDILAGRVSKILPGVGGLLVQISPRTYGKVHFTEIADTWVDDPLSGYHEGQFVKCVVLEITHTVKGTTHFDLSLRSSSVKLSQDSADLESVV